MALPLLLVCVCACDDDDAKGGGTGTDNTIEDNAVLIDSVSVKTALRTYVFKGAEYTNTGKALLRRVTDEAVAMDGSVRTAVVHNDAIGGLSGDDYKSLAALIARGGNVVYCSPTRAGVDKFVRTLQETGKEMYAADELSFTAEGYQACRNILLMKADSTGLIVPPFLSGAETNGVLCDALAFRGGDYYIVSDNDEQPLVRTAVNEDGSAPDDSAPLETADEDEADKEYVCGLHADGLAAWLDGAESRDEKMAEGRALLRQAVAAGEMQELSDIANANSVGYSFNACFGNKKARVSVNFDIWAVNDRSMTDYYLVHQTVTSENSKLRCGPAGSKKWYVGNAVQKAFDGCWEAAGYGKDDKYSYSAVYQAYYAYMTRLMTQAQFNGGSNVEVSNVSPANSISGQTTYTENLSWSINACFISGKDPRAQITGGVKVDKSWSRNVRDLNMTFSYNTNRPKWEYTAGALPKRKLGVNLTHDEAREILRTDCTVGHCWVWKKPSASGSYSFTVNTVVDLQGLWVEKYKVSAQRKDNYKTVSTNESATFTLAAPPRYEQKWNMYVYTSSKDDEAAVMDFMTKYLPDYWSTAFSTYTVEKDDRMAVDLRIKELEKKMEENASQMRDFKVPAFRLSWATGGKEYHSYSYTPAN